MTGLGNCVTPSWLGQPREEEADVDVECQGSPVELRVVKFMGVAGLLERNRTCVGVASLGFLRGADNRGVPTCWETDGVS